MYVYHEFAVPQEARRGYWMAYSCELPCGFWGLNPGPLEKQPEIFIFPDSSPISYVTTWLSFSVSVFRI